MGAPITVRVRINASLAHSLELIPALLDNAIDAMPHLISLFPQSSP
jgi:hypothetical protein